MIQYLLKLRKWVKASRLRTFAGCVCVAVSLVCAAMAVGCLLPASYSVGQLAFYLSSERVYEAPASPNPNLDGCLVKLKGTGLSTECELEDAETRVKRVALVLRRAAGRLETESPARYGSAASAMRLGAYRLLNTPVEKIWPYDQTEWLPGAEKVKSVPGGRHVLCLPSPSQGVTWYVVGRQQGDALHMEDPAARFCTSAQWEACHRAFSYGDVNPWSLLGGVAAAVAVLFLFLWGTVACWRSGWSCLVGIKEYSRIPAWLTALFCAPAFALLAGGGYLLNYYITHTEVYQYVSQGALIFMGLLSLAVLLVWYRLRRWFKTRFLF